jgi:hypothetical protein
VPKKKNIGFNHTTVDALREGDKETSRNTRRIFSERKVNALCSDLAPVISGRGSKHMKKKMKKEKELVGFPHRNGILILSEDERHNKLECSAMSRSSVPGTTRP